jgi:hypothetical protein
MLSGERPSSLDTPALQNFLLAKVSILSLPVASSPEYRFPSSR